MKYEDLMELENGALIKIKGKGFLGKIDILIHFKKDYVSTKGYFSGSSLYPLEWLYLATHEDYEEAIKIAKINYEKTLKDLKISFEKSEKVRTTKVLIDLKKKTGK